MPNVEAKVIAEGRTGNRKGAIPSEAPLNPRHLWRLVYRPEAPGKCIGVEELREVSRGKDLKTKRRILK